VIRSPAGKMPEIAWDEKNNNEKDIPRTKIISKDKSGNRRYAFE
jgi:hypothetical protein